MDAFPDHRFAAAQPPPPPPPPGDPSFHTPPPPPTPYYYPHQNQQPPFPHQEPPNYPPYHHHLPPPPFPYHQQWPHPEGHQGMPPLQPQLPPYSQYPSHYPGAPPQPSYDVLPFPPHHYQYPPHAAAAGPPPGRPHGHHHLSPSPPPQSSSAYPPLPPPGWGSQSWAPRQGWEYPGNYQSQAIPIGNVEERSHALHDQNQSADHHIDTQQSSFSQSSIQHPGVYTMEQQTQAHFSSGLTSYPSRLTSYGAEGHSQSSGGDQVKSHLSPTSNYGPTSSIYEQEVPYNYSSTPGNRLAVNHGESLPRPLPYRSQEGFTGLQSNLPERNVPPEQLNFTHDGQPFSYASDASNRPLDFHPRTAPNLAVPSKPSHGLVVADPIGSTGVMDPIAIGTSINAWTPAPPDAFTQSLAPTGTQFDNLTSQQSISLPHAPVFGGLPGPSFRPNMPHVNTPFGLGVEHANQVAGYAADVNGTYNFSERPKKSAVPKWLQEEIIKNKSVIASHNSGSSHESLEFEDAGKSYEKTEQDDQKSIIDSTQDDEDDENAVEAEKSAAINQEIKHILTEVLLKVTDEFFNQIATKVLDEDGTTIEATTERNDQENHKVTVPSVLKPKASAKILVPLKEKSNKFNSVNNNPPLGGGNILGLANYASDEEDDDEEESGGGKSEVNQSLKLHSSSKLQESDGGSSGFENKKPEKGDVLAGKGEIDFLPRVGFERKREHLNQNPQAIDIQNGGGTKSLHHTSMSDELHNKKTKRLSDVVGEHKSVKSGLLKDAADKRESRNVENTGRDAMLGKSSTEEGYVGESKNALSIGQHQGKDSNNEDTVKKTAVKDDYHGQSHENRTNLKEKDHLSYGLDRKESTRDKKGKIKEESELKKKRENKEDCTTKDSVKYSSRRSPSPSNRGRSSKESSSHGRGSISSDEPPENSKKRKLHSRRSSTSRSPTRARARQVSRSPDRKHSHRRHSPYSSTDRRIFLTGGEGQGPVHQPLEEDDSI